MADGERMQLRSMVEKDKESNRGETTTHDGEGPDTAETITPIPTDHTQEWSDGLDDLDRAVRVSSRKVRKFWYIPDLKNTQLKSMGELRLQHPNDPMHILINAPELKRFFKTSTFEISIDSGKVYTYTDPKVDIGVGLEDMPFDIEKLEEHFKEYTKVPEVHHKMERIPLMERTTPTTEVMPLREFENNVSKFLKLCKMYGETSCELSRRSLGSEEETTRAFDSLQPYISDILEQIEKGHALFRIEREVRNRKGRGRLTIPYIVPKERLITNAKQLKEFVDAVDDDLRRVIEDARAQEEEFENREQARREEEARQEQVRRNTRSRSLGYEAITSTPLREQSIYPITSNRQTNRNVLFDPNPTRHSYTQIRDSQGSNGSDGYDQLSNDSLSQDTDTNDRISPTSDRDTDSERRSNWQRNNTTGYGNRATGSSSRTSFQNEQSSYPQRNTVTCYRCGEQGHIRTGCSVPEVYCTICRTSNHGTRACRRYNSTNDCPPNSSNNTEYHPTATPPQGETNGLFAPTRTSTAVHSPIPGTTNNPDPVNITAAMTLAVQQGVSKAIGEGDVSKQMLKNLERFDGKDRSKCLEWISNVEIIAQHSKKTFRELICQSMSPSLLHIFSSVSTFASDQDIKDILLANYSDVPSMAEAVAKLHSIQMLPEEPLATFNSRYQQIHQIAYDASPEKQTNKTAIIDYVKKLPAYSRDKLLKKLARKDSYIKTLQDAFRNAIEINREISFVDATTGRAGETRLTQINELDDSFPDYEINAMSTRSTDRSGNRSFDRSFDRSSSRSSSQNSSFNSRPNFRSNNSSFNSSNSSSQSRHSWGQKPAPQGNSTQQRSFTPQNRFEGQQNNGYTGNNKFEPRRFPTKFNHSRSTPKAQVIFEYTDQNPWDVIHTVRNFINYMKGNPAQRQFFKTNKIVPRRFNTEVNESEIQSSNLEQIQQAVNEDQDLVFDALVAADYIDEINTSCNDSQQSA